MTYKYISTSTSCICYFLLLGVAQQWQTVTARPPQAKRSKSDKSSNVDKSMYEVWASDQSNSEAGLTSIGVKGGFLWIWNQTEIEAQIADFENTATPMTCTPNQADGPCNMLEIFPQNLVDSVTGLMLGDLPSFGRIHGVIRDPFSKYIAATFFSPGGGYVGVIDSKTKEAIAVFRATGFLYQGATSIQRTTHMSLWTADGSAIIVDNLGGKAVERIDITRTSNKDIVDLKFNLGATIGLGNSVQVIQQASVFSGLNAFGKPMMGSVVGTYSTEGLKDTTPNGFCKENGCPTAPNGAAGGRPNTSPICPIPSANGLVYTTMAGGGLFVLDSRTTPMSIVGEYGNAVIYGAGCGGIQSNNQVFLNSGVSASEAGASQSMQAVFSFDDTKYGSVNPQNTPMPVRVFQDAGNTISNGNVEGNKASDETGQLPAITTRRDAHGAGATIDGAYIHVADRIQNLMEVFDVTTYQRTTYDLTSLSGQDGRTGAASKCFQRSVLDDANLPLNDPAPDLLELTPDGKYFMIAFRGPVPVSVNHGAQGSCPGVGIVEVLEDGKFGKLVDVLRASNTIDTVNAGTIPGGVDYSGIERSDVHNVIVVTTS